MTMSVCPQGEVGSVLMMEAEGECEFWDRDMRGAGVGYSNGLKTLAIFGRFKSVDARPPAHRSLELVNSLHNES